MRLLIIGGTNFIGSAVVRRLREKEHTVAVFHRGQTNLASIEGVEEILGDCDHLAERTTDFRRFAPDVVIDMIAYGDDHARMLLDTFRGIAQRVVVISS